MTTFTDKVRPLHWVFKIGHREKNIVFFRDILGMKTLRHEEFSEGCNATCNGPYNGFWSKTMIGYGDENTHFVIELTYNYSVESYVLGNDFRGLIIQSREALTRAKEHGYPIGENGKDKTKILVSPDGYKIYIVDEAQPLDKDPVLEIKIGVSNLENSLDFWHTDLQMTIISQESNRARLCYSQLPVILELESTESVIERGSAHGRIAFSVDYDEQPGLYERLKAKNRRILNALIMVPTPGKVDCRVLIFTDPDGQEICFVEDKGFRELSLPDVNPDEALNKSIQEDKRDEFSGI